MAARKTKNPVIRTSIPAEWVAAIQECCVADGIPLKRPGMTAGVSWWVHCLIARQLGFNAIDQHERQAQKRVKPKRKKRLNTRS